MAVYYNEHEAFAAAWLRELMAEGLIPKGDVDERSIIDVTADDVRGYQQCHWFAGIGGWAYALRLAGWPDDREVWTGSCPCQPFSSAGARQGGGDGRHLWPHWARLIRECRPVTVFGEQVEAAIAHGWLDAVFDDLEREGYACGAACVPAAGVGAPHIRQRVWFVAQSERTERIGRDGDGLQGSGTPDAERQPDHIGRPSVFGGVADAISAGRSESASGEYRERNEQGRPWTERVAGAHSTDGGELGDTDLTRPQGRHSGVLPERASKRTPWSSSVLIACRDGKSRPAQPGIFPLAHGVSNRVGTLRGAGNAIVAPLAAEFIKAYTECR